MHHPLEKKYSRKNKCKRKEWKDIYYNVKSP